MVDVYWNDLREYSWVLEIVGLKVEVYGWEWKVYWYRYIF